MSLDSDALLKMKETSRYLQPGDDLVVSPNVVWELRERVGITDVETFLQARNVRVVPSTPGAAVPATKLRQTLDAIRHHRGNLGDALNISEAGGHGADIFITGDKRAVNTLTGGTSGTLILPNSNGTKIFIQVLE